MRRWTDSPHPYIFFNQAGPDNAYGVLPYGIGIISLNPRIADEVLSRDLNQILSLNGFDFNKGKKIVYFTLTTEDYTKLARDEARILLCSILGISSDYPDPDSSYVLTIDVT